MGPRIVLHTGKGGVGKTSVAAATGRRAAAGGARTLVLSTDPAHSLADVLGVPVSDEPTVVGDGLWAEQVQPRAELERNWAAVREWLSGQLLRRGADRVSADELAVPPGVDELLALLRLRRHAESDEFDVVVVDCAPTGETLRLLSLPDVARWWLDRVVPAQERGAIDAARPFARAVLDVALPGDEVLADVTAVVRGVLAMGDILRDADRASVRLVMTPERLAVDEARRTFTYLNLYGFPVDAVVVNRVFPAEVGDYFGPWRERQEAQLREVTDAFAPVPVLRAPYFAEEVRGDAMLDRLGDAAFGDRDVTAILHTGAAERLELSDDSARLHLPLPLAQRGDVSLRQVGSELVVRVQGYRRTLLLPPALHGWSARGAAFADGALTVELEAPVA
ncbi:MAG: arsenite/tail-anchored protein-transporting ATPase [Solirubrobacteraceae bacterium]|jgi:arsenite-transporting ATPase|nr:arsenite/tail-anchored protein-transporting ATPase [Solirubrobacteraceae bacterium]